jgi:hypothetical protein
MIAPHDLSIYWFVERYEGYCRALGKVVYSLATASLVNVARTRDQNQQFELGYAI